MRFNGIKSLFITFCVILVVLLSFVELTGSSTQHQTQRVVLLTGFEPFGSYEMNPSQLIVETLHGEQLDDVTIYGVVLPVDFERSAEITTQLIDSLQPILVISIGLEAKADGIRIERLGLNLQRDPYGSWEERCLHRIHHNGPFLYVSSLPAWFIVHDLRDAGIPARQSVFAGAYACNAVLYQVLNHIKTNQYDITAGFLHVPLLTSQDSKKGMDLDRLLEATCIVIQTSLDHR